MSGNEEKVYGDHIKSIRTQSSHFDGGEILEVSATGHKKLRISTKELVRLLNGVEFDVERKRVYGYLRVNDEWLQNHDWCAI